VNNSNFNEFSLILFALLAASALLASCMESPVKTAFLKVRDGRSLDKTLQNLGAKKEADGVLNAPLYVSLLIEYLGGTQCHYNFEAKSSIDGHAYSLCSYSITFQRKIENVTFWTYCSPSFSLPANIYCENEQPKESTIIRWLRGLRLRLRIRFLVSHEINSCILFSNVGVIPVLKTAHKIDFANSND
jgi:hypothetical protein